MVCVDNSEFMRNGDFIPTRLQAQQDAVSLVCHSKTRSNPENNVGLLTMSSDRSLLHSCPEVLATLTSDVGRILSKLHQVQPKGDMNLLVGIRIAHLALKHRQGKNHKMRIIAFVGSPIDADDKELIKLAKRLKKEKVNVDIVNFGEDAENTDKLTVFINTINGKEGTGSHLVTVPPGPHLSDALITSPVIQGEDGSGAIGLGGAGFEFGVDPNEDPELALALRVSMEEQRQRQEEEARKVTTESANDAVAGQVPGVLQVNTTGASSEEAMLEQALAMSLEMDTESETATASVVPGAPKKMSTAEAKEKKKVVPDFAAMTEEEQIAYAMQMSLSQPPEAAAKSKSEDSPIPMDTDDAKEGEDYSDVMNDPEFLQSVLENLPGVDPQSATIRQAVGLISQNPQASSQPKEEQKKDGKKTEKK